MKKEVLPNGLTVIYEEKKGSSVVVEVMVKVGSNDENDQEHGLTHFIEHLLFEGTAIRPSNRQITNEIEKIGGDFNAYTTNERTCFYVKVLKKHFSLAVEILADIIQNPLFKPEHIAKEKNIILKEIDLVHDEPRFYQWVLLQRHLFQKNRARYPTYGEKKTITGLTREKIFSYFQKYYVPNNMTIIVVGDVPHWNKEIKQRFIFPKGHPLAKMKINEPPAKKPLIKKEKKNIANTYLVMGFKTVPKNHPDSYVLEVINGILGRGQSGRMFHEIRGKLGLAYEVGTQNINEISFGYFAIYATIDKKNQQIVRSLILKELQKLQFVSPVDVQEAKDYVEGAYSLELEDSQKVADQLAGWQQAGDAHLLHEFLSKIKKVTPGDVQKAAQKYFHNYTLAMVEGKK